MTAFVEESGPDGAPFERDSAFFSGATGKRSVFAGAG
jgi:hypothetical protein